MKSFVCALIVALMFPISANAGVTFVSTDDELNQSLVMFDNDEIESLAVAQAFYVGSAKRTKDRIRGLIAGLYKHERKGVYVYGQALDVALAGSMLGDSVNFYLDCATPVFVGRLRKDSGLPNISCGIGPDTEESIVRRLSNLDRFVREK